MSLSLRSLLFFSLNCVVSIRDVVGPSRVAFAGGIMVADLKMVIDGVECEIDPDDTIDDVLKCAGDGDGQQVSD